MTQRVFRSIRKINRKVAKPSAKQIQRAARAILYPEAGDPLPPPGSLLEREARKFVEFIGKQEEAKELQRQKGTGDARPN